MKFLFFYLNLPDLLLLSTVIFSIIIRHHQFLVTTIIPLDIMPSPDPGIRDTMVGWKITNTILHSTRLSTKESLTSLLQAAFSVGLRISAGDFKDETNFPDIFIVALFKYL